MAEIAERQHIYNPWHYRHSLEPLRTYCGYIKYVRKKHLFTLTDAQRILDKLTYDVSKDPTREKPKTFIQKVISWVWRAIFSIAPVPGFLVPFEEPFITWYVSVMDDCNYPDFTTRAAEHTELFGDRVLSILADQISLYGGEDNGGIEEGD